VIELILVRHAIAEEHDPARWPDDRERPLTKRGVRRFKRAAEGLAELVPRVDLLLSSPLRRAWHTATILEDVLGWPQPFAYAEMEPEADPARLLPTLEPLLAESGARRVALVGHEPHISHLVSYLLAGPESQACLPFKKGGAASLTFDGQLAPGQACLGWLATPKALRAMRD
jgi:phosphohistidine phosphatase